MVTIAAARLHRWLACMASGLYKSNSRKRSSAMSRPFHCRVGVRCAMMLAACALSVPSFAEVPNISGVWNRYPPMPSTFSGLPDPPEWIVPDPPLKEPYKTQWHQLQEKRAAAEAAGKPLPDDSALCRPDGTPMIMWAHYALQILQNPDLKQITVLSEFMAETRRIYLDEDLPPIDSIDPGYFGYSVARWNGHILEVTTAGIREDVRFMDIPHSSEMIVKERIFLDSDNHLVDKIEIEDPQYLTGIYGFKFLYKKEPLSYKIAEFVCDNQRSIVLPDGSLGMEVEAP
ncbi:MAG: hypothetical protein P8Y48_17270 [Novosphingobium sp.]